MYSLVKFVELCAAIPLSHFRTFCSPPKRNVPICIDFHSHHQIHSTNSLLLISVDLHFLDISYKWDHGLCSLSCVASFTSHNVLRLIHVVACILLPKLILLHGCIALYLSTYPLMKIWLDSTFWLLWLMCVNSFNFI